MPKLRRPWTPEDDARLRSLLEAGASVSLVAAKLKRTQSAVKNRKAASHIRVGKAPELKEREIMEKEPKVGQRN
jgi:DNA invertase Pin-like site-specific DNA recombinase